MSFIHPQAGVSDINRINLARLQKFGPETDPVTELALHCFDACEKSKLGASHYIKKYGVSTAAFLGTFSIPVALGGWALTYIIPRTPAEALGFAASAGGALVFNKACKTTLNFSPLTYMITISGALLFYGAAKVSEATFGSYQALEKDIQRQYESNIERITSNLKETYDGMASELVLRIPSAQSTPGEMIALQSLATELQSNLPRVKLRLSQIGLQDATISLILNNLEETIRLINGFSLELKADDIAYNIALLLTEKTESVCIPTKALNALATAKAHTLGVVDALKKVSGSLLGGVAGFGAAYGAAYSMDSHKIVAIGASIAASSAATAASFYWRTCKERAICKIGSESFQDACQFTRKTYDAIASHLLEKDSLLAKPGKKRKEHLEEVKALHAKMAAIHTAFAVHNLPLETTEKLQNALNIILKPKAAPAPRRSERTKQLKIKSAESY